MRIAPKARSSIAARNVFKGYWNKPEKTAETMTPDGWLQTGDVGRIDNEGFLRITGRLRTSSSPSAARTSRRREIENRLKFSPYISDAVVIGDKRKYLSCLVMIDQENVEKFAQDHACRSPTSPACRRAPEVRADAGGVDERNPEFARVEQIKDFRLIDVLLTARTTS